MDALVRKSEYWAPFGAQLATLKKIMLKKRFISKTSVKTIKKKYKKKKCKTIKKNIVDLEKLVKNEPQLLHKILTQKKN